eukprot:scaffold4976_cov131-Isochrysis_galbana.AAC.7
MPGPAQLRCLAVGCCFPFSVFASAGCRHCKLPERPQRRAPQRAPDSDPSAGAVTPARLHIAFAFPRQDDQ